jgi:FlaA1/EpsC-like NDP-sugar epimerase/lipopolysaccharide/colanic/teichoic acid biosynthesis glycosyltransferase
MYTAKRLIDILLSIVGIILFMPLMVIIGLIIKINSRGPVFFLADRVGKDMKSFKMYKFRTMIDTNISVGYSVCPEYDPRVTTFGRFLRRMKLNELPQFINILKGEMTFVGPRPEAPDLAELYPEEAKLVFSVIPGLVGPSTILGRNEAELYPSGVDTKKYYIEKILPKKVEVDLEYIKNPGLVKDIQYILMGVKETLIGALRKKHIYDNRSQIYLFIADTLLIFCSYFLIIFICSVNLPGRGSLDSLLTILFLVTVILLSFNIYFGMYNCLIRYISYHEILGVLKGVTSGSLFLVMLAWIVGLDYYSKMIVTMNWAILILTLSGLRVGLKLYWNKLNPKTDIREKRKIFIVGANEIGISAYNALCSDKNNPFDIVGFIDDTPNKYGKKLHGIKVLGNCHHIKDLAKLYKVEEIILTKPNSNPKNLSGIINICQKLGLKYWVFSSLRDVDKISQRSLPIRNLKFTDFLPREKVHVDYSVVKKILTDKTVLLNGSCGALGLELCTQILQLGCRKLIIIDRYESYLAELLASIGNVFSYDLIIPVVCDIRKTNTLEEVFENHQPDIVIHASTRKYTPFFTLNIDNVGEDNYLATFKLAKMVSKFKSEFFLMISSLEAAQNGSLITDSLRVAEVSLKHFFNDTDTQLIIARICDIIENRGGVVSVIENQILRQGTVTIPSADTKTFLISKYSAAAFILQTLVDGNNMANERRIFTCKPVLQMSLVEVASKLSNLYGLKLEDDIPIIYTSKYKEHSILSKKETLSDKSIYYPSIKAVKYNMAITDNDLESLFKEFVVNDSNKTIHQDWKAQTRELIKLCKPDDLIVEL